MNPDIQLSPGWQLSPQLQRVLALQAEFDALLQPFLDGKLVTPGDLVRLRERFGAVVAEMETVPENKFIKPKALLQWRAQQEIIKRVLGLHDARVG